MYEVIIANSISKSFSTEAGADAFVARVQALLGDKTPILKNDVEELKDRLGVAVSQKVVRLAEYPGKEV